VGTNLRGAIAKEEASLQRVLLGATKYIYSKDGKTKAFEASALPDSTWTFVEARQEADLANYKPRYDFNPIDSLGEPAVSTLLDSEGITLLLLSPSWRTASQAVLSGRIVFSFKRFIISEDSFTKFTSYFCLWSCISCHFLLFN